MVLSGFGKILKVPHNLEVVGSNPAPATYPGVETFFDPGVIFCASGETRKNNLASEKDDMVVTAMNQMLAE